MKIKNLYLVAIIILLLILNIIYFKPLLLSDTVDVSNQIIMVLNESGVRNGEPYINSVEYQTITSEQKNVILDLFEKYPYKRTFATLFSDGSMSGLGNKTLYIYMYDDISLACNIFITSTEKIVINEKNYSMENSEQLIEQIINIMEWERATL